MDNRWDYHVSLTDLKTVDTFGNIVRNRKATVETETGRILGLVSPTYQPIQNKTLYDIMVEVGNKVGLTLNKVNVVKNGSGTIFRYGFGEAQSKVVSTSVEPNDKVNFGIEFINSFDSTLGSSRFQAFAERLVCLNGMIIPKEIARFSFKDLGGMEPETVRRGLIDRIAPICNTAAIWEGWAKIIPNRVKVEGLVVGGGLGKTASKEILEQYDNGRDKSIWGLYNLITFHISHKVTSEFEGNLRLRQYALEKITGKFYTDSLV